jgi:RNA polymerase sigma-70 factor (family 1)
VEKNCRETSSQSILYFWVDIVHLKTIRPDHSMPSYSNLSETELLDAIRANDEKAFSELIKRFWLKAHSLAYSKIRSKELTQEIVQDLFVALWDKRTSLVIHNFSAYLYTSIRNKAINYIESRIVEQKYWDYYKAFIPHAEAPEHLLEYNELVDALDHGIANLPKKSRRVFQLSRMEGRSVAEIARLLNLSEKAIEYHITRSLKHLRVHLKDFITSWLMLLSCLF